MSYWWVWPVGIVLWLAVGWGLFSYFEANALKNSARPNQITLSMFMWTLASKFPLVVFLAGLMIGLFFGGLSVHVLWHWCPVGSVSEG